MCPPLHPICLTTRATIIWTKSKQNRQDRCPTRCSTLSMSFGSASGALRSIGKARSMMMLWQGLKVHCKAPLIPTPLKYEDIPCHVHHASISSAGACKVASVWNEKPLMANTNALFLPRWPLLLFAASSVEFEMNDITVLHLILPTLCSKLAS